MDLYALPLAGRSDPRGMTMQVEAPFVGSGEMVDLVNGHNWASGPLGPIANWSPTARSLIQQILASNFPMFLWLGPNLVNVYNDAYRSVLGDKHPSSLGQPAAEIWREIWDVIGPLVEEVIDYGGRPYFDDLQLFMERSGFLEETYFTFSYSPFYDEGGVINGVFCACTETTQRVVNERRFEILRGVSEALLDIQTSDEAMSVLELLTDSRSVPASALYLGDDAAGLSLRAFTGDAAPIPLLARDGLDERRSVERAAALIFRETQTDGRVILSPLIDSISHTSVGWLAVLTNPNRPLDADYRAFVQVLARLVAGGIAGARLLETERKEAEALAEIDRAKTTFFSNVSHEFRTPLTLMLAPVRDALEDLREPLTPGQKERLEIAHRNGMRMTKLVDSLLEMTKLSSGQRHPDLVLVNLDQLTEDLTSAFQSAFDAAGVDLSMSIEPIHQPLLIDVRMWESIVLNLLSNALKYTLRGRVSVSLRAHSGRIEFSVSDTGVGIPAPEFDRIFERFHRVESEGGRWAEGLGIGLALVKELSEQLRGTVSVQSEPGVGSVFRVELPVRRREGGAGETEQSETVAQFLEEAMAWPGIGRLSRADIDENDDAPRILVVDDNVDMNGYLCRILADDGQVQSASNAVEGLELARRWRPHVIVSDVMMPQVDGFEFTQQIRDDPELRAASVVLLSARAGPEASIEGFEIGADDYIVKPFTSEDLTRRVKVAADRALARHREQIDDLRSQLRDRVGAALGEARTVNDLVRRLHREVESALGNVLTSIAVHRPTKGVLDVHPCGTIRAELAAPNTKIATDSPLPPARVVRSGKPLFLASGKAHRGNSPAVENDLRANDYEATANLPLLGQSGQVIGCLILGFGESREWKKSEMAECASLAEIVGSHLARVMETEAEHTLAQDLQRMLLRLNQLPLNVAVAASYFSSQSSVGGDWYDAFSISDELVGVVIGDVAGAGLPATASMGQLRSAAAAAGMVDRRPGKVIEALDRIAARSLDGGYATAIFGTIDGAAGIFEFANAGHVPPALVTPDGSVRLLEDALQWPLGLERPRSNQVATIEFPPGSLLLMYTDGLIERRGESLDLGLGRLAAKLKTLWRLPTALICERLIEDLVDPANAADDVAVLAVRAVGGHHRMFADVIRGSVNNVPEARRRLDGWLRTQSVDGVDREFFVLAMSEALGNAARHGSHNDPKHAITIEACLDDNEIVGCVRDHGGWSTTAGAAEQPGGIGLQMMRKLVTEVDLKATPDMTRVVMRLERKYESDS